MHKQRTAHITPNGVALIESSPHMDISVTGTSKIVKVTDDGAWAEFVALQETGKLKADKVKEIMGSQ